MGKYCFRQLPSASVSVRGNPRHAWADDGRWRMGNNEETEENWPKWQKLGQGWGNIASVSCRGRPWTSAACVDGRRMMEDGNLRGKKRKMGPKDRNQGDVGEILLPSDSCSLRHRPRTSVGVRGICGRKAEDGRWEIMRKNRGKLA